VTKDTTLPDEREGDFEYTAIEKYIRQLLLEAKMAPEDFRMLEQVFEEMRNQDHVKELHESEVKAYGRMENLRGINVPRVYAQMEVPDHYLSKHTSPILHDAASEHDPSTVRGLLLRYIPHAFGLQGLYRKPGFSITQYFLQSLGAQAVSIVRRIGEYGVLNIDCRPGNTFVH
jgi:hypothetical protein